MRKVLNWALVQSSFFPGSEKKGRLILIKNRPSLNAKEFLHPPHFHKGGSSFRKFIIHDYAPEAIFQFPLFLRRKNSVGLFHTHFGEESPPPTFYCNIF